MSRDAIHVETEHIQRPRPPRGLINPGKTCYINSVLQILFQIPSFTWVCCFIFSFMSLF